MKIIGKPMKNTFTQLKNTLKTCVFVSFVASAVTVSADDTEVFSTKNISNNLLFVMDVSGSMREQIITTTTDGGATTTSGGTPGEFDQPVTDSTDDATQLYEDPGAPTAGEQEVDNDELNFRPGNVVATRFHFGQRELPQGANIQRAYLTFFSAGNDADNTAIDIYIEDAAANYADSVYGTNWRYKNRYYSSDYPPISDRSEFGVVRWDINSAWNTNSTYDVDVTDLVQQVVNRSDWGSRVNGTDYDDSLAFKFVTNSGERTAYSFDGNTQFSPELRIEYTYTSSEWERYRIPGCSGWWGCWDWRLVTATRNGDPIFTFTQNSYEDAEQAWTASNQSVITDETNLSLTNDKIVALRFALEDEIPVNSVITNAYIQFTAATTSTEAEADINIQIENTGASLTFGGSNPTIKQRSFDEGTQRNWQPGGWTIGSATYAEKTPDLTQMVQSVVDRNAAEALTFRLFGSTGDRIAKAMDANSGVPSLHVEYQIVGATSGSTTTGGSTTTTRVATRLQLMQEALREVLIDAPHANVGLMKYAGMSEYNFDDDNDGRTNFVGGIVFPVSPIYNVASTYIGNFESRDSLPNPENKKVREFIADVADEWEAEGGTPIVDAIYEAALYFRGEQMHHGKNKNNTESLQSAGSHPASYFGGAEMPSRVDVVGRDAIADAHYKSPITSECQGNYMVLMSDGAPTYYKASAPTWGDSVGPFASELVNTSASELSAAIPSCLTGNGEAGNTGTNLASGTCGRELTQYLATEDQIPDVTGRGSNDPIERIQTVKTFVIGFGSGLEDGAEEYLRSLETIDGDGGYYAADNKASLKSAFRNIFETIAQSSGSLASPGYSVNVKNGLEHEKDIYIPVFDRRNTPTWSGNLKKFALVADTVTNQRLIKGKNNKAAVDAYGAFTSDALDFWSTQDANTTTPDGTNVLAGGVAEKIEADGRLVLTDAGCSGTGECNLTASGNDYKLLDENATITSTLLGIDNQGLSDAAKTTKRRRMINFIRGWEEGFYDANASPKGYSRKHMGDMLHSEPVVITYAKGAADGSGKKQYILAGTNEGYLHAFDTATGEEVFAFMPSELLKNIDMQFTEDGTAVDHKYGIDGSMTYWHDDSNNNREVDNGEKVYVYFGLRRGGRSYYALDISGLASTSPVVKRLWKKSSSDTGMSLLGQSWSPPYVAKVGFESAAGGKENKEVVIVSGGYDEVHDRDKAGEPTILDNAQTPVTTTMGHNVYILDAVSGDLLWDLKTSMNNASLTSSIPGGLKLLDVNENGLIDRMYFADVDGDLWRLDLSEALKKTGDDKSVLTKFADLASSDAESRKFYTEPDVASLASNGKTSYMVSIGSGFRAHPNDKTINDKFFVIKDTSPFVPLPEDYSAVTVTDLATVTIAEDGAVTQAYFDTRSKGWTLGLPNDGEKVMAPSITFNGMIAFTTLTPAVVTENVNPCAAPTTEGRFYAINILTGKPALDLIEDPNKTESDPAITDADISKVVIKGEIAGKPQIVFNEMTSEQEKDDAGNVISETCKHGIDVRVGKAVGQVSEYDACRLESIYWNSPKE